MNTYRICVQDREQAYDLSLKHMSAEVDNDYTYYGRSLREMEKALQVSGLTFYITYGHVPELPSYGDDVVAVALGDEWCRPLPYLDRVRVAFRCYGHRPYLSPPFYSTGSMMASLLQYGRSTACFYYDHARYLPGTLRRRKAQRASVHLIPMGYLRQQDLPIKPMHERSIDVLFVGSVVNRAPQSRFSPTALVKSPKEISRSSMLENVNRLSERFPELKIHVEPTESFEHSRKLGEAYYSKLMMDAKVCLVPRGSLPPTFRYFEALRYGCAVVAEPQPKRWYYEGSPAVEIPHWDHLADALRRIFQRGELERLHQAGIRWWEATCSEKALGAFMAEKIHRTYGDASSSLDHAALAEARMTLG